MSALQLSPCYDAQHCFALLVCVLCTHPCESAVHCCSWLCLLAATLCARQLAAALHHSAPACLLCALRLSTRRLLGPSMLDTLSPTSFRRAAARPTSYRHTATPPSHTYFVTVYVARSPFSSLDLRCLEIRYPVKLRSECSRPFVHNQLDHSLLHQHQQHFSGLPDTAAPQVSALHLSTCWHDFTAHSWKCCRHTGAYTRQTRTTAWQSMYSNCTARLLLVPSSE